jgi:hypothetical protein
MLRAGAQGRGMVQEKEELAWNCGHGWSPRRMKSRWFMSRTLKQQLTYIQGKCAMAYAHECAFWTVLCFTELHRFYKDDSAGYVI